jgi:fatty acid synthase
MKTRQKPDVVISGSTGRFPASGDLEEFKQNLFSSVDMVTEDDTRWPIGEFFYSSISHSSGKLKS